LDEAIVLPASQNSNNNKYIFSIIITIIGQYSKMLTFLIDP